MCLCAFLVAERSGVEADGVVASTSQEKLLMKMSVDDTSLPAVSNTDGFIFDSDSCEDATFSQSLPVDSKDCQEHVLLLDTDDGASFLQMPCLVPESVAAASSLLSENDGRQTHSESGIVADGSVDVHYTSPEMFNDDDVSSSSMQKSVESQPFDFVNDFMQSCSPTPTNKATVLPRLRSRNAEFDALKAQGGQRATSQTADSTDS